MTALEKAIAIAVQAHAGQTDKAGAPYILHPLRLMLRMGNETEMMAAVLHDVVEDGAGWTFERLAEEGIPAAVINAVDHLTKREEDKNDYDGFIRRAATNAVARRVKLADLEDNMDMRRIENPTEKDFVRLAKYRAAYAALKSLNEVSPTPSTEASENLMKNTEPATSPSASTTPSSATKSEPFDLAKVADEIAAGIVNNLRHANHPVTECRCHTPGLSAPGYDVVDLGFDGWYAEASLETCKICGAIWLEYRIEQEYLTAAGRWYRGIISESVAKTVTLKNAVKTLEGLDWWLCGGSLYGSSGRKQHAPLHVH